MNGNSHGHTMNLLVIQATPFCNINCTYCYLPDRLSKDLISMEVVEKVFKELFDSNLVSNQISVVWHAGEPLVAPIKLYEKAFSIINKLNKNKITVTHSIQTNAILVNQEWCNFIKTHDIRIGVSVDGPSFLHDKYRLTRSGKGTIDKTLGGIEYLKKNNIDFHVITVLTNEALDYPDEICSFYVENGINRIGFNVEETEGINLKSSIKSELAVERYKRFMNRFIVLSKEHNLRVREFNYMASVIEQRVNPLIGQQSNPFSIISIDCKGNISTFSPELIGMPNNIYGNFVFGNILETQIRSIVEFDHFQKLNNEIQAGVAKCKEHCEYFSICGGGAPANKFYENQTFASTETMYCKLTKQSLFDVVLENYEQTYFVNH
jgi:uncharacterized protein